MLKVEGVLHFTIPVKDLDRSEKFYTGVLGFEKIGRNDRIVFLRAGEDYFNLTYSENPITTNVGDRHEIHSAFRLTPQAYDEALRALPARGIEIRRTVGPACSSAAAPICAIPTTTSSSSSISCAGRPSMLSVACCVLVPKLM